MIAGGWGRRRQPAVNNGDSPGHAGARKAAVKRQKIEAKLKTLEQAQRVAWRIIKD